MNLPLALVRMFDLRFPCPECGAPVRGTTLVAHLTARHPDWKREAEAQRRDKETPTV